MDFSCHIGFLTCNMVNLTVHSDNTQGGPYSVPEGSDGSSCEQVGPENLGVGLPPGPGYIPGPLPPGMDRVQHSRI